MVTFFSVLELPEKNRKGTPLGQTRVKASERKWLNDETDTNLLDYVSKFKYKLFRASEIARENLKEAQSKMKKWYYKDA